MLILDTANARNAHDIAFNATAQHPSTIHIKDRIAGVSTRQIIALARCATRIALETGCCP